MYIQAFRLFFQGPLHISSRPNQDLSAIDSFIHSDTLASAVASVLAEVSTLKDSSEVKSFLDSVAFSSGFPFVAFDDRYYYFYPLPLGYSLGNDPRQRKKVKKVRWLERTLIERLLRQDSIELSDNNLEGAFAWDNMDLREGLRLIRRSEHHRVQVARTTGKDADPYTITSYRWEQGQSSQGAHIRTGLFFLVRSANDRYRSMLNMALEILKDKGLGADRTVGFGHFQYEEEPHIQNVIPAIDSNSSYACGMALGMYSPSREEFSPCQLVSYELSYRGGWITIPGLLNVRRNSLYMFTEGSVFYFPSDELAPPLPSKGAVVDVTPPLPIPINLRIYRSGHTLFLPLPDIKSLCTNHM